MGRLSVGFVSLGCAKNLVDSEHMAAVLRRAGIPLAPSPEEADVALVNTCGFIGDAKTESIAAILAACERKRAGGCRAVVVAGCLAQRYREELRRALPEVDAWVGLDRLDAVARVVRRLERGETGLFDVPAAARRAPAPPPNRPIFTGGPFAYLKIAEGCSHRCAFCAIPAIRGPYRSRPLRAIVREAETLLARGVRELNLVSQNTTAYGRDRAEGAALPALLRALGRIGGRFWIRLLYGHPAHVTPELLETMGAVPQVCRYLDVPVQHCHPAVLAAMRRGGSARAVRRLPAFIRERLPGVTLRTTLLVGFPGETDARFRDLLAYVREAAFDHLGVFAFSREEGTAAFDLRGRAPRRVAEARRAALLEAQQAVVFRRARERVGQTDTVLLHTEPDPRRGEARARSAAQAPEVDGEVRVRALARDAARAGRFLRVRYTAVAGYDLRAEPEDETT